MAQDTVLVNYQGYLTDNTGNPVNGSPAMTFTIYDETGGPQWSETHPSVPVTGGLFSVLLGSQTSLLSSVFDGTELYLGVQVGSDPEMTPRTLLTSAPGAAFARSMAGDIRTQPGRLLLEDESGNSGVVLAADPGLHAIELHPPDPCVPPEPCTPALELIADTEIHGLKIHPPDPCLPPEPCNPATAILAGDQSVDFDIYIKPPDDDEVEAISLGTSVADGSTHMSLMAPHGNAGFNVGLTDDGGVAMGIISSPGVEVMGVEPSPFNFGYALRLYDPTSVDGTAIVEVSSQYGDGAYGKVNVGYRPPPDDSKPGVELTSGPSQGKIIVGGADPGDGTDPPIIVLEGNAVAQVGIGTDSPAEALHVVGNVYVTGGVFTYTDTRGKTNIEPIANALDKVDGLSGVTYNLRGEVLQKMEGSAGRQVGFLAQEVEQVVPEAVKTMPDGYKAVDYARLTALLVEAVKDLKAENDELRSRVAALESR
jgi:hypothetical protein